MAGKDSIPEDERDCVVKHVQARDGKDPGRKNSWLPWPEAVSLLQGESEHGYNNSQFLNSQTRNCPQKEFFTRISISGCIHKIMAGIRYG
jgi:hypothetical protein